MESQESKLVAVGAAMFLAAVVCILAPGDLTGAALRLLGVMLIPAYLGFAWRQVIEYVGDPTRFLSFYCSAVTALFTVLGLARIEGLDAAAYAMVLASAALIVVYLRGLHYTRRGGTLVLALLVAWTCFSYWVLLGHVDVGVRWLYDPPLSTLLLDVCFTGVFLSLTPHVFLLDLIQKLREADAVEHAMGGDSEGYEFLRKLAAAPVPVPDALP